MRQALCLGLVVCEINFLGITHKDFKNSSFFSKVSAGLAQISETSRFRDWDFSYPKPRPGLGDLRPAKKWS